MNDPDREIEPVSVLDIDPRNIELVRKALVDVVQGKRGTGWAARSEVVNIGGKTGTTQVVKGPADGEEQKDIPEKFRDHAWFVAFAPEEDPQIVVSVFVEHGGHGSTGAAPIAKRIIETYFKNNKL